MERIRSLPLSFPASAWAGLITSMWAHHAVHHTHNKTPVLPGLESCNRLSWLSQGLLTDHLKNPSLEYSPQQETGYIAWKLWRAMCCKQKNYISSASLFSPLSHFPTPFLGLLFLPWLPGEFPADKAVSNGGISSLMWLRAKTMTKRNVKPNPETSGNEELKLPEINPYRSNHHVLHKGTARKQCVMTQVVWGSWTQLQQICELNQV